MIRFVPLDSSYEFKARLSQADAESVTQAEFTFYRKSFGREKVLETVKTDVADRVAKCAWTASGLEEQELEATVFLKVKAGATTIRWQDEIRVYRDSLEVTAKDEQAEPQPDAICELTVIPDAAYRTEVGNTEPLPKRTTVGKTGEDGVASFNQLPPGQWSVTWRRPFELVKWNQKKGPKREAVLKRGIIAQFVWPDPAEVKKQKGIHKQIVNFKPDVAHPEYGPELKIKIQVEPDQGRPGKKGDTLYMSARFNSGNSERNSPKPEFEGKPGGKGTGPFVVKKSLAAAEGVLEFTLKVGIAGGDEVYVKIGGTEACEDASLTVVNWRKIAIRPVCPVSYPALPEDKLPKAIQDKLNQTLGPVFIQADMLTAKRIPDQKPQSVQATVVTPETATRLGWAARTYICYTQSGPEKILYNDTLHDPPDPIPTLNCLIGHRTITSDNETFSPKMTAADSAWLTSTKGGNFLPIDVSGNSVVGDWTVFERGTMDWDAMKQGPDKPAVRSYWEDTGGHRGDITGDFLDVAADKKSFRIRLPAGKDGDPGRLVSEENPVSIYLRITTFQGEGGSSTGNWVSANWKDDTEVLAAVYVILHEFGHSTGQAVESVDKMPGMKLEHDFTYTGRDHSGSHCFNGLPEEHHKTMHFRPLVEQGIHGTCIMFGGVGPLTRYAEALQFCAVCAPFVQAWPLDKIGK